MKNKYPIKDVYVHRDILFVDIAKIMADMTPDEFHEFYFGTYRKAMNDAMVDPYRPKTPLEHKLVGWSRLNFFSMKNPKRKFKPDYRFVYKYNDNNESFYKLAVCKRNAKGLNGDSVYHVAEHRPKELESEHWEKETD